MSATPMSPEAKRALFEAFEKARTKAINANDGLTKTLHAIVEQLGQGPFKWNGEEVLIAKRGDGFVLRTKKRLAEEIV